MSTFQLSFLLSFCQIVHGLFCNKQRENGETLVEYDTETLIVVLCENILTMGFSMHQAGGDLKTFPQTVAKIPQFNRKNVFHVLSSEGLVCSVHMVDWVRLFEVSIKLYSGFDDMASTKTENSSITDQILLDNHFAFCALDVWIRIRWVGIAR